MELVIQTDGNVRCVYGELLNLSKLGDLQIRRGSHVEPDQQGNWTADLSPLKGPVLGPFEKRSDALAAEQQWLNTHWLIRPARGQRPAD